MGWFYAVLSSLVISSSAFAGIIVTKRELPSFPTYPDAKTYSLGRSSSEEEEIEKKEECRKKGGAIAGTSRGMGRPMLDSNFSYVCEMPEDLEERVHNQMGCYPAGEYERAEVENTPASKDTEHPLCNIERVLTTCSVQVVCQPDSFLKGTVLDQAGSGFKEKVTCLVDLAGKCPSLNTCLEGYAKMKKNKHSVEDVQKERIEKTRRK